MQRHETLPDGTVVVTESEEAPVRSVTPREFMDRLPLQVQAAIATAATQNGQLLLLLTRLNGGEVRLDSDETKAGVAFMLGAQLITQAQAEDLLR